MASYAVRGAPGGRGVFATRPIAKGEPIMRFTGPRITYAQVLRKRNPDNPLMTGKRTYIDLRAPGVLVNHSCDPNAGLRPDLWLVAIKPIRRGQQIMWDYSTSMGDNYVCGFRCRCGVPSCRGEIGDFRGLPAALRRRYTKLGVVQSFLRK